MKLRIRLQALHCVLAASAMLVACASPMVTAPWPIPPGLKVAPMPDGYPLAYEEAGSGVPVILVHGAMSDHRSWYAQMPELPRHFRVINVNLRRHYPEPWDGKGPGFEIGQHADDIAALVRSLGLGKAHVIGHSRGGTVAFHLAVRHPGVVRSLVLADANLVGLLPETPESEKAATFARGIAERMRANYGKVSRDDLARDYVDGFSGAGTWDGRTPEQKVVFHENVGTGLAEDSRRWPHATCADTARLSVPVLVVHGQNSPRSFHDMGKVMRDCNAAVPPPVVIKQASHIMNRQQPADFNAAIVNFLSTH